MFALGNVDPDFDDMATKRTESEYILAAQNSLSIAGMEQKPCFQALCSILIFTKKSRTSSVRICL